METKKQCISSKNISLLDNVHALSVNGGEVGQIKQNNDKKLTFFVMPFME